MIGLLIELQLCRSLTEGPVVFAGNMNAHHKDWWNSVSSTEHHSIVALDFATIFGCKQLIYKNYTYVW